MKTHATIGTILGLAAVLGTAALAAPTAKAGRAGAARHAARTHAQAVTRAAHAAATAEKSHRSISAAEAEKIARGKYHGKVVGQATTAGSGGRDYSVRLLSGKTMRDVMVNRTSGKIESARIVTANRDSVMKRRAAKARTAAHHTMRAKRPVTRHS
jgi:uncharacterized membrane protein YkoI